MMTKNSPLPPVDEMPVLQAASDEMVLTVAVSDLNEVYIFHDKPFQEEVNWVEYNTDNCKFVLISPVGRLQSVGLNIPEPMKATIEGLNTVFVIHVVDGVEQRIIEVPLVRQKYKH